MARYIVSRLVLTMAMALLATLVIFLIANLVPGDPILAQLGDVAASNKAFVAEWRAKWGLDLPLLERYLIFLKGLAHGDLGISIASQRPVLEDIAQYAPATIELSTVRDSAAHLVLPSLVLAAATLGLITRTTRASMLDNLHQDYVRVARAKGLAETSIVNGHVLPNALIPIVTLGGLAYANLLTGAVMTETVFSWPGLGRYTFRSAEALDFPAIMGITLVVAATYLIINLIIDLSYAVLDPRVAR